MESHLTVLAKTVAQMSLELKSFKSLEDIISDLRRDFYGRRPSQLTTDLNANMNNMIEHADLHKSLSEPNLLNAQTVNNTDNNNINNRLNRKIEFQQEKERFRNWAPSYTNPRKLKKLTK